MDEKNFLTVIADILKQVLKRENVEELRMDSNLIEECGLDSLSAIEILVHIELMFEIEVDDDDLNVELVQTPKSLWEYIKRKKENEN